jgi:hypothetical protein
VKSTPFLVAPVYGMASQPTAARLFTRAPARAVVSTRTSWQVRGVALITRNASAQVNLPS